MSKISLKEALKKFDGSCRGTFETLLDANDEFSLVAFRKWLWSQGHTQATIQEAWLSYVEAETAPIVQNRADARLLENRLKHLPADERLDALWQLGAPACKKLFDKIDEMLASDNPRVVARATSLAIMLRGIESRERLTQIRYTRLDKGKKVGDEEPVKVVDEATMAAMMDGDAAEEA